MTDKTDTSVARVNGYAAWNEREARTLRALCLHEPTMPELAEMHEETASTLRSLLAERDYLDALVEQMQAQDVAAIKRWRTANPGNDLCWPDQMRLTAWCMGEVAKAYAERDNMYQIITTMIEVGERTTAERDAAHAMLAKVMNRLDKGMTDMALPDRIHALLAQSNKEPT